mgnify:CR=1 FL=1
MRSSRSPEAFTLNKRDEIERLKSAFDAGIVIFGWQTYPQSCYTGTAVSPLDGARCTTREDSSFPVRDHHRLSERKVVTSIVVAMIVILVVVAATVGLVLLGIEGRGKQRAPESWPIEWPARAQHLNGDAEPPARLVKMIRVHPQSLSQVYRHLLA